MCAKAPKVHYEGGQGHASPGALRHMYDTPRKYVLRRPRAHVEGALEMHQQAINCQYMGSHIIGLWCQTAGNY